MFGSQPVFFISIIVYSLEKTEILIPSKSKNHLSDFWVSDTMWNNNSILYVFIYVFFLRNCIFCLEKVTVIMYNKEQGLKNTYFRKSLVDGYKTIEKSIFCRAIKIYLYLGVV